MFRDIKTTWVDPQVLYIHTLLTPPPIDVDYIDVSDMPITDPARLLSQESVHPFWVEYHRRETQHNAIEALREKVLGLLHHYYWDLLIMPNGINKCPYPWEIELSEKILDAFTELEESIDDSLEQFEEVAIQRSWNLWEYFGCDDGEYAQALIDEREAHRRKLLRYDFQTGIRCLLDPTFDPNADLPF